MTDYIPPRPDNAVDLLKGSGNAAAIVSAMSCAYWAQCDNANSAVHHRMTIHREFAALAAALGYTIARGDAPEVTKCP